MKRARRREIRAKKRRMRIPAEADWGDYKADLDQEYSHRMFIGKSNEEMQPYFRANPIESTDEVRWMPLIPFQYYILGLRDFVLSVTAENYDEASDAASCFLRLVLDRLENTPNLVRSVMPDLLPALEFVGSHQALFDAQEEIYGSFPELLEQIKACYRALCGA